MQREEPIVCAECDKEVHDGELFCGDCVESLARVTSPVRVPAYALFRATIEEADPRVSLAVEDAEFVLVAMWNELQMLRAAVAEPPKCCSCGCTDNLEWGPDPYAYDINNDDTPVWECDHCREQSAMDI